MSLNEFNMQIITSLHNPLVSSVLVSSIFSLLPALSAAGLPKAGSLLSLPARGPQAGEKSEAGKTILGCFLLS